MKKGSNKLILIILFVFICIITRYINHISMQQKDTSNTMEITAENILTRNGVSEETSTKSELVKQIEPIIWYADITHDGIDEKIVVDLTYVINDPITGEEQTVSVYSGSTGDLIWTGHADTVHIGWNGIYVYNDGNNEYLLIWKPTIYQGRADFLLQIFSLNEKGEIQKLTQDSLQFDLNHPNKSDTIAISSYIDKVNRYLKDSYVLVDTDNAIPIYSTNKNKIENLYDASAILHKYLINY